MATRTASVLLPGPGVSSVTDTPVRFVLYLWIANVTQGQTDSFEGVYLRVARAGVRRVAVLRHLVGVVTVPARALLRLPPQNRPGHATRAGDRCEAVVWPRRFQFAPTPVRFDVQPWNATVIQG